MTKKRKDMIPPADPAPLAASGRPEDASGAPHERTVYDTIRENAEAFVVAVILAIVIRHFAVEAFEIPTGSMANTLYGLHAWLECPNCSTDFNVALASDSSTQKVNVPYTGRQVYEGKCENPSCTLDLHPVDGPGSPITCLSCGTKFAGKQKGYRRAEAVVAPARCPLCRHLFVAVIEKDNVTGGHKILVTKFAYALGKPERWDVIVFEFDQWKNYIKRLVGLPGERIDIWDGDLYVDGKIQRKSAHPYAQDVLWTKVADSDIAERGLRSPLADRFPGLSPVDAWGEVPPPSRPQAGKKNASWNAATRRWSVNALPDAAVLRYQRGFDNYYSYNLLREDRSLVGEPHDVEVGDKKVAFTVNVAASGPGPGGGGPASGLGGGGSWIGAEVRDGDFTFQLRIPVGTASAERPAVLERVATSGVPGYGASPAAAVPGEEPLRDVDAVAISPGASTRIELENADDRVAARVNGTVVLEVLYSSFPPGASLLSPPPGPSYRQDEHHLAILLSGVQAELSSIQVHRDMFYIDQTNRGPWQGIQLGPGEYFAMGDNAPSSSDGRYWGSIPEKNMMGKALLVFWPAWPTNFQWKFIR